MRLRVGVDGNGVDRIIEVAADSVKDLTVPLKQLGKFLRVKAKLRFDQEGPGWPARKQASSEKLGAKAVKGEQAKLEKAVAKAWEENKSASAIRRKMVALAEFKRQESRATKSTQASGATAAQALSVSRRARRARNKGTAKPLLGKIVSTITATVNAGTLTVESTIPWAGVHNEGGQAGNGAKIPARPFLELEDEDLAVFQGFLLEHFAAKLGQ